MMSQSTGRREQVAEKESEQEQEDPGISEPSDSEDAPDSEDDSSEGGKELSELAAVATNLSNSNALEEYKRRYEHLCQVANVTADTKKAGWALLLQIPPEDRNAENDPFWMACALWAAGRRDSGKNDVHLWQVLQESNIRMVDFFDPLKSFIALLKLGPAYEEAVKLLEKKYVVMTILFQKYEKVFAELLITPTFQERQSKGRKTDAFRVFSLGWTLYLIATAKLLPRPPDVVNAFHLMLCLLNFIFAHAPPPLRKIALTGPELTPYGSAGKVDCLAFLCAVNAANLADVLSVNDKYFVPFVQSLVNDDIIKVDAAKSSVTDLPLLHSPAAAAGLLDGPLLAQNKQALNNEYMRLYHEQGEFDERLFVDKVDQIGTPTKVTSQTRSYYHLPRPTDATPDHSMTTLQSPYRRPSASPMGGSVNRSPLSTTLASIQWLTQHVAEQPDGPSETLLRFFRACARDVTESVVDRVKRLIATIELPSAAEMREDAPRLDLAVRLYYRVLQTMLLAEEARLQQGNFTTLLNHDNFHASLLACCVELVLFAYKMVDLAFPYVLNRFGLKAFDFCKVIESIVRHEPEMPRVLVRHLSNVEERILESLAWDESSPLLTLLEDPANRNHVANSLLLLGGGGGGANGVVSASSSLQQRQPPSLAILASPMPSKVLPGAPSTPAGGGGGSLSVPQSPQTQQAQLPLPTGRRGVSHSLELFFRKVFHLVSIRSRDLCCRLQLPPRISQQAWLVETTVLLEHPLLMRNRHVDQMVLCALYGVCRVNQLSVTFRAIIDKYRDQPQANSKVFREVELQNRETRGDIINFYNHFFVPAMEPFLLQFQQQTEGAAPLSDQHDRAVPRSPAAAVAAPPVTVTAPAAGGSSSSISISSSISSSSSSNAGGGSSSASTSSMSYLSPMRARSMPSAAQPGTPGLVYAIGSSPKDLQAINSTLNSPAARPARQPRKRLFQEPASPLPPTDAQAAGAAPTASPVVVAVSSGAGELPPTDDERLPPPPAKRQAPNADEPEPS